MECPHCGKTINEVIDSRPTKGEIAIRRRRHCLACGSRFTTYECTEEKLLLASIKKDASQEAAITNLKVVLTCISTGFKALTKEAEKLMTKVDKLEKAEAAKESKKKAPTKKRTAKPTATDQVVNIIKRSKKGVDAPTLMKKTGLGERTVRNIIFKAGKRGKIKRSGRGVYVAR
jgi:transcriptional regulator NrdR family protein